MRRAPLAPPLQRRASIMRIETLSKMYLTLLSLGERRFGIEHFDHELGLGLRDEPAHRRVAVEIGGKGVALRARCNGVGEGARTKRLRLPRHQKRFIKRRAHRHPVHALD